MRKLSKTFTQGKEFPAINLTVGQSLVLFDGVLDSEKLLCSDEIQILVKASYGLYNLSYGDVDCYQELQDWLRDELVRSQFDSMIYPVKAKFEDLAVKGHRDEFSGPLNVILFHPDDSVCCYLVFVCHWTSSDGLFRNNEAVVGVIVDNGDLEDILKNKA